MPGIVTGHADNGAAAQQPTGLVIGGIFLAYMHAVTTQIGGEVRTIIQDERDVVLLGDRQKGSGGAPDGVVIGCGFVFGLEAKLQTGDIARRQGFVQCFRKGGQSVTVEIGRADQIKTTARSVVVVSRGIRNQNLP